MQTYYNEQWLADKFMQVNASKTKEMAIGKRSVTAPSLYTPNSQHDTTITTILNKTCLLVIYITSIENMHFCRLQYCCEDFHYF